MLLMLKKHAGMPDLLRTIAQGYLVGNDVTSLQLEVRDLPTLCVGGIWMFLLHVVMHAS
jgi:hypothetical protein